MKGTSLVHPSCFLLQNMCLALLLATEQSLCFFHRSCCMVQTSAWANQKTASRLCKAAMLQRYLNLTAKLTDLQNPHKQLPSADSQVHGHAGLHNSQHPCGVTLDQQEQQSSGPMASEHPWGTAPGQQDQQSAKLMLSERIYRTTPDQREQQSIEPVASGHSWGPAPGQQEQQSVSRGATQPCSSGAPEGCKGAGRNYRQCKQVGSGYSRQWQELRRQQLFSNWMHKPEHLQDFSLG